MIINIASQPRAGKGSMIVCLCHAVSESTVRRLAGAGASAEEIARGTGAGTACGCCASAVAQAVAEAAKGCGAAAPCPGCPHRGRAALQAA